MPTNNSPRSGADLKTYLRSTTDDLRGQTGTRPQDIVAQGDVGLGATRYFGKQLETVGALSVEFYKEAEQTGAFKGLGFSAQEYAAAFSQMQDRKATEATLRPLYEDARAEATAARNRFADMTMRLSQTQRGLLTLPGTDPAIKSALKGAGGALGEALDGIRESRIASRESNSYVLKTEERASAVETENSQLRDEHAAREAQKDLRLQLLGGEPLRPEDLVVLPRRPAPGQPAAPRGARRRSRR